ncbi:uncharacterized protein LOC142317682 [Lycorma delicatula]|uniref:uncharacterized protein LOC142317682 n=1 Tax=Lycorma delicatula TaxID=130591 RepID=UPI003F516067
MNNEVHNNQNTKDANHNLLLNDKKRMRILFDNDIEQKFKIEIDDKKKVNDNLLICDKKIIPIEKEKLRQPCGSVPRRVRMPVKDQNDKAAEISEADGKKMKVGIEVNELGLARNMCNCYTQLPFLNNINTSGLQIIKTAWYFGIYLYIRQKFHKMSQEIFPEGLNNNLHLQEMPENQLSSPARPRARKLSFERSFRRLDWASSDDENIPLITNSSLSDSGNQQYRLVSPLVEPNYIVPSSSSSSSPEPVYPTRVTTQVTIDRLYTEAIIIIILINLD